MYNVVYCIILTPRPAPAPRPPPPAGRVGRVTAHASGVGAARRVRWCVLASCRSSRWVLGDPGPGPRERRDGAASARAAGRPRPRELPAACPSDPGVRYGGAGPAGARPGVSRDPRPREPR